jgi:hypothetical protein
VQHEPHSHTFAFPERVGPWAECDGCTDEHPKSRLTVFREYNLCPECLEFHKGQVERSGANEQDARSTP